MQNNHHTENPFENRQKTGPPTDIEDQFTKNKTISSEADLNVNKISTEEEIKNRKFLKITGPKKAEEEDNAKKIFVFNNNNKDQISSSSLNNPSTLFSNPFQQKTGGLFSGLASSGNSNKDTNDPKLIPEPENKPKLFANTTGDSLFKNPFLSNNNITNSTSTGGLFGNASNTGNNLFGNIGNPKPSGLFANAQTLFPTTTNTSLFGNPAPSLFGNSTFSFNTTANQKGFESSEDEGSDFENPEEEVEIKPTEGKKIETVKVEVNEKMLKIPCSEFFIYDFGSKKYNSIGKGDFTIEFAKTDEKKESPLLIFRNSVLKILFQGIYRSGVTKLETVNKNFKTISVIQKALVINEQTKKVEFKSVKILHVNDSESKMLIDAFNKLEQNNTTESKDKKSLDNSQTSKLKKEEKESPKDVIDINKVNKGSSGTSSQTAKEESTHCKTNKSESIGKIPESKSQNIININKMETPIQKSDKQEITSSIVYPSFNSKTKEIINHQSSLSQNENGNSIKKIVEKGSISENSKLLEMNGNKTIESKIVVTENIENKTISIESNHNNKPTESKSVQKISNQSQNEKISKDSLEVNRKDDIYYSGEKQSKPISVGKITNINIQLIVSNKSKDKSQN